MSWSMVKETALRDLVRHGVAYADGLMALSDVDDVDVPYAVARLLADRSPASPSSDLPKEA